MERMCSSAGVHNCVACVEEHNTVGRQNMWHVVAFDTEVAFLVSGLCMVTSALLFAAAWHLNGWRHLNGALHVVCNCKPRRSSVLHSDLRVIFMFGSLCAVVAA